VRDRLGDGYNFNFGVDVAINPVISIEALYSFNGQFLATTFGVRF